MPLSILRSMWSLGFLVQREQVHEVENDPYVVAKINRAKTSKGPRNSRCLSEGRRRISGEVLPNEHA